MGAVLPLQPCQLAGKVEVGLEEERSLGSGSRRCREGGGGPQDEQTRLRKDESTRQDGT